MALLRFVSKTEYLCPRDWVSRLKHLSLSLSANYLYRVLTLKRNHNETVDTNPLQK